MFWRRSRGLTGSHGESRAAHRETCSRAVLLMDPAFLPFAGAFPADAFRDGHSKRTAVVLHGLASALAAGLFNLLWLHADSSSPWPGSAPALGALLPLLGVAVLAALVAYYWLPIRGELGAKPATARGGRDQPPSQRPPE